MFPVNFSTYDSGKISLVPIKNDVINQKSQQILCWLF